MKKKCTIEASEHNLPDGKVATAVAICMDTKKVVFRGNALATWNDLEDAKHFAQDINLVATARGIVEAHLTASGWDWVR